MAVEQKYLNRMGSQIGQVVHAQLFQGLNKNFFSTRGFDGKPIGPVLIFSGKGIGKDRENS